MEKILGCVNNFAEPEEGLCGAKVSIACQGTYPLRKTCKKCKMYDASSSEPYHPKTLKEAREISC